MVCKYCMLFLSSFIKVEVAYPKAGTISPNVSLHVYHLENDTTFRVDAPTDHVGKYGIFCGVDCFSAKNVQHLRKM